MNLRLERFIDPALLGLVEESRVVNAERRASGERRGPANERELAAVRAAIEAVPIPERAEDRIVRVGGHEVGVRVIAPASGESRAVYVDVHGGGFFMGTPVRGDARNARLADALGVTVVSVDYRPVPLSRRFFIGMASETPPGRGRGGAHIGNMGTDDDEATAWRRRDRVV